MMTTLERFHRWDSRNVGKGFSHTGDRPVTTRAKTTERQQLPASGKYSAALQRIPAAAADHAIGSRDVAVLLRGDTLAAPRREREEAP
jgi:hypothetical protein